MRFDIISIKERVIVGGTAPLTPDERNFVLDCINEATSMRRGMQERLDRIEREIKAIREGLGL